MPEFVPADPQAMRVPAVESPFLEEFLGEASLSDELTQHVRDFAETGYVVFDLHIPDFDAVADRIVAAMTPRYEGADRRVAEAWYFDEDVRAIATSGQVLDILRLLYQREPIPFQTLNFEVGTEQPAHSDTLHFHCVPRHFMCGVWVALEDIHPDSGPLFIHPGSHRLPDFDMHDLGLESSPQAYQQCEELVRRLMLAQGFEKKELLLKKGQAAIWSANLFHGGTARVDRARTRQSLVTHYYFEDCFYYFPMASDPFAGRLCMREVIDIRTGKMVSHRYRGSELDITDYENVWTYPRPLPDWVEAADEPPRPRHETPTTSVDEADLELLRSESRSKDARIAMLQNELKRARAKPSYRFKRWLNETSKRVRGER